MITYEEYKTKYGIRNEKTGEIKCGISKEIFDLLNTDENYAIAFESHISTVLINDIVKKIDEYLKEKCIDEIEGNKKNSNEFLNAYRRLGDRFKDIIRKNDEYIQDDRFHKYMLDTEAAEFFENNVQNVIPLGGGKTIYKRAIQKPLAEYKYFYHAINTNLGKKLRALLSDCKQELVKGVFNGNGKAYSKSFDLKVVSEIETLWNWRIKQYEENSSNLKFINRSVQNAGNGRQK